MRGLEAPQVEDPHRGFLQTVQQVVTQQIQVGVGPQHQRLSSFFRRLQGPDGVNIINVTQLHVSLFDRLTF